MKITDFPLGEVPYLAIDRLIETRIYDREKGYIHIFDSTWLPTKWLSDLMKGRPTPLVYWYPSYIDHLYSLALMGEQPLEFLNYLHKDNVIWFPRLFTEVHLKLNNLRKIKLNHLNETQIQNGRVTL